LSTAGACGGGGRWRRVVVGWGRSEHSGHALANGQLGQVHHRRRASGLGRLALEGVGDLLRHRRGRRGASGACVVLRAQSTMSISPTMSSDHCEGRTRRGAHGKDRPAIAPSTDTHAPTLQLLCGVLGGSPQEISATTTRLGKLRKSKCGEARAFRKHHKLASRQGRTAQQGGKRTGTSLRCVLCMLPTRTPTDL
jgi:hypothetical protein